MEKKQLDVPRLFEALAHIMEAREGCKVSVDVQRVPEARTA